MDITKVLEKMDHNSETLSEALSVSDGNANTLRSSLQNWSSNNNDHSRVIQIILSHESLTDNEKIFCLVEFGKLLIIQNQFDQMVDGLSSMYDGADGPLP
jgi:hypothetical protein